MNFFTKTKFLIATIVILSAIIVSIFATMGYHRYRMERRERKESREHQPGKYIARQLQLTPEQVKEFDSLREKFRSESELIMRNSHDISKAIMDKIMSENPNVVKLKELAQKFGELQEQQKQMMINHLLEVRSKCSPTQQIHFKKLIKQMENHDKANRGRERDDERKERD